ncbi:thioredoxin family protein [Pontibacter liquoris]|uniref:thioredoxin family protein n=1 Tax=Pontibacter liquoris TaxID=2905677 RepID=UPI001FA6AC79|nr:DUF255 domain-containing protein [Pontibacter liquoris]
MLKTPLIGTAAALTLLASVYKVNETAAANLPGTELAQPSIKAEPIHWLTIEEAAARQKKEPRKMMIDVYTDWCGWCKKMDKTTFADPELAAYVNAHYYAIKLDAEGKDPITLDGHTFKYNPEYRSHELAIALLNGQMSYPSTVYLDEEMKMLSPVPGYLDAPAFMKILRYFGGNHHKTMTWQEYEKK